MFQVSGFPSLRYSCDFPLNIQTKLNPHNNVTLSIAPSLGQEMDNEQFFSNVEVNDLELAAAYRPQLRLWNHCKTTMDTFNILKKSMPALESIKSK